LRRPHVHTSTHQHIAYLTPGPSPKGEGNVEELVKREGNVEELVKGEGNIEALVAKSEQRRTFARVMCVE